jgi:hypothetical protein
MGEFRAFGFLFAHTPFSHTSLLCYRLLTVALQIYSLIASFRGNNSTVPADREEL